MTLVRLIGNTNFPLKMLSPRGEGLWDGIEFTTEPVEKADFLVSLNYPPENLVVECPKEHCWSLIQEPPSFFHHWLHTSHPSFFRLYSCDHRLKGAHRVLSPPYLRWYLNRSYDWLVEASRPKKTSALSTITSGLSWMSGHKKRLNFLRGIQDSVEFDWYGRGVKELPDKWDGLAPYRYSLTFENYRSSHYWTEKLIDCFLAWTIPIYCGSSDISAFFPSGSFVEIDLDQPKLAEKKILETVQSDFYEQNFEALCAARNLVLERYNPLAFIASEIKAHKSQGCPCKAERQLVQGRCFTDSVTAKLGWMMKSKLEQVLRRPVNF